MLCWPGWVIAAPVASCHLHHPSAGDRQSPRRQLETYPTYEACEQGNRWRYSGLGRCHCGFGNLARIQEFFQERSMPMPGMPGESGRGELP
ncbi:MAG: hypothetical protein FHK82_16105 [Sedimenticola thiotaurini]|uniref:Uncharacterized protein n=1 Tax=Sedimenticola thiotaurini TaxID=1543721 RepID=A0A558CRD9_9GAMM|nr:MAG: hypothetical protein FHK82_16105 [Sedimenticola thiotaurini]